MPDQEPRIVAHLIPWVPFGGGAESLLLDICREIDKTRFRIVVFYWADSDELAEAMREAGAQVVKLPFRKVLSLSSVWQLARALKEYRADILHTHFMDSDFVGFWASFLCRIPIVMHVHSFSFPQKNRHALRYRIMSPWITRIICVSDYVKRRVISRTGIRADKCVLVPNGTNLQKFEDHHSLEEKMCLKVSLGIAAERLVVGSLARLSPEKSLQTLLLSAPFILARHPSVQFLIVGDGPEREKLAALSRDLGISARVTFTGRREDVSALLSIMDVFVLSSVGEAFGIALLEAMASGKPVAASMVCAIPEVVRNGEEGILFWPRSERALAEAVGEILSNPELAAKFSAQGRQRAKDFSSRSMTEKLEQVYCEILNKKAF
ncbi:MAG: glycosyltransferase [Candidatus Omnitrophica bacterium]|nr:glycosyltransferase [Candidatus Omnitrophota bacterium]